jgi:4-hydroxybenzoate polyprenyltransferase
MRKILDRILTFGRMVRFSHTLFAMPFALTSIVLASFSHRITLLKIFWIIVAMVGARSAAMGFNRIVDRDFDAKNPRTKNRELPAEKISVGEATLFVIGASLLLVLAAHELNPLCFYLSPVALAVVFFYSFTKRFTWLSHLFLGLGMGLAPIGAWLGIAGEFAPVPVILGLTVVAWGAGFDIIYSLQDLDYDDQVGLFSMPKAIGVRKALIVSSALHVVAFVLLVSLKFLLPLSVVYLLGLVIVGITLVHQHRIVRPNDLSKLNFAFFNMNAYLSVGLFLFTLIDAVMKTG